MLREPSLSLTGQHRHRLPESHPWPHPPLQPEAAKAAAWLRCRASADSVCCARACLQSGDYSNKSLQTSLLQPSLSVPTLLLRRTGCSLTTSSCSESMPQSARCPQGTAVPLRDGEGGGKRCTKTAGCGSQVLDSDDDEDAAPPLPPPPEVHVEMKDGMQGRRVNGKARNCLPLQGQKKEEGRSAEASRRGGRIRFQR